MAFRDLWALMCGAALLLGCAERECEDSGRTYEHGEHWTCSDGCNGCSCDDGMVARTAAGCPEPPGDDAGKRMCFEGDRWHPHGENWPAADGCELQCNDGALLRACD